MRPVFSRVLGAALFTAVVVVGLLRGDRGTDPEAERVARLIRQLGDDDYDQREAAHTGLLAVGESALPALRAAVTATKDLEIRRRAHLAIRAILTVGGKSRSTGMTLVGIEPGEFTMGSPPSDVNRRPGETSHVARITRPFLLASHEVTQDQYQKVMAVNPSWFRARGPGENIVAGQATGRFPVDSVSWFDAVDFCNRLSRLDGFTPYYRLSDEQRKKESIKSAKVAILGGAGYRLPTEAEWEYACRGGMTTLFHFGDETKAGLLNCKPLRVASGYGTALKWPELSRTSEVGSYPRNGFGLYDMHGNVAEWCGDWYEKDAYLKAPRTDPEGPAEGIHRVLRGGSWVVSEASCRSASRHFLTPDETKDYVGFRVARTPGPGKP